MTNAYGSDEERDEAGSVAPGPDSAAGPGRDERAETGDRQAESGSVPVPEKEAVGGMWGPDGPLLKLIKDRRVAFLIIGAANTGVGFVWFALFSFTYGSLWPHQAWTVFAVIVSAHIMSTLSAFVLYRKLVFRVRGHVWLDFFRFQLVYLTSFLLNMLVVPPLKLFLGMPEILAQFLFTFVIAVISYVGHSRFSFHRKDGSQLRDVPRKDAP